MAVLSEIALPGVGNRPIAMQATAHRSMRRLAWRAWVAMALWVATPVWAAAYTFPGALPTGCSSTGTGTYSCGTVNLGSADTVNVVGTANVTVAGNFDIKGSQLNASGSAADMNVVVSGTLFASSGATFNANITAGNIASSGAVNYGGSLTTLTGYINLGQGSRVTGSVNTSTGTISLLSGSSSNYTTVGSVNSTSGGVLLYSHNRVLGDTLAGHVSGGSYNTLGGTVTATASYVSFGDHVTVNGHVSAQSYVYTGHYANINGNITSTTLQVDTASNSTVTGSITANGTYVNLGWYTTVGGPIVAATYVDAGSNSSVGGDITARTSYIDTGNGTSVTGSLVAGGTYIDIHSDARIGGSLTARTYVSMYNNGTVGGAITAQTGTVFINDHNSVGGDVTAVGSVTIDDHTVIAGNVTSTTSHVYISTYSTVMGNVTAATNLTSGTGSQIQQCARSTGAWSMYLYSPSMVAGACCGAAGTCGKSCIVGSPVPPSCKTLHHIAVQHGTGTGLTCAPNTVTLVACADSTCSSTYTGGVSGSLTAIGSGITVNFPSGSGFNIPAGASSTTVSFQPVTAGKVTVDALPVTPLSSNGTTCNFGNPSCAFTVADSGFAITVPAHVSGTSQTVSIAAIQKSAASTTCVPAFANVVKTVAMGCSYSNPATGQTSVVIDGVALNTDSAASAACDGTTKLLSLTFNGSGIATPSLVYNDVGKVTLNLSLAGADLASGLNMSGTSSFVVAPSAFTITGLPATLIQAGAPFSATISAVNANGVVTPNFGREAPSEGIRLSWVKASPTGSGANAGTFTGTGVGATAALTSFANGAATVSDLAWTEVGTGDLTASLASGNYLSSGLSASGTTGNTGAALRSVPHHFDVGVTQGCGSITYSGQPFGVTVTARNASNGITLNYNGSSATAPPLAKQVTLSAASNGTLGSFATGTATVASGSFLAGIATVATPVFTFSSKLTGPSAIGIRAQDTDGVSSIGAIEGIAQLRSGRLRITNAFGTEKRALTAPVQAQYWSSKAWVLNSLDNCTKVPIAAVSLDGYLDAKGASTSDWHTAVVPDANGKAISMVNGNGTLTLEAPTAHSAKAPAGSVDVSINLGSTVNDASCLPSPRPTTTGAALGWLRARFGSSNGCAGTPDFTRDPSMRATFGVYAPELKRLIHSAEVQ